MILLQLLDIFLKVVNIYVLALVVYALISWFPGAYDTAFGRFLSRICEPYLSLFEHLPLSIGGLDFTIMVAVLVLELAATGLGMIVTRIII